MGTELEAAQERGWLLVGGAETADDDGGLVEDAETAEDDEGLVVMVERVEGTLAVEVEFCDEGGIVEEA